MHGRPDLMAALDSPSPEMVAQAQNAAMQRMNELIGSFVNVEGQLVAVQEPFDEVMRLREQALVAQHDYREGEKPLDARLITVALTGPNGLPIVIDPARISLVMANRGPDAS